MHATCQRSILQHVLYTFGHPVATYCKICKMFDGVGSSLKMVKFFLQNFLMLQDVAYVWPAPSQHLTTLSNNVACVCLNLIPKVSVSLGRQSLFSMTREVKERVPENETDSFFPMRF